MGASEGWVPLLQCKIVAWLLISAVAGGPAAFAQSPSDVELIVRPADTAPADFLQRLQSPLAKQASDSLLAGVSSSRATFAQVLTQKQGGVTAPSIPAYTLTVPDSSTLSQLQARLQGRSEVQYVQPNVAYTVDGAVGAATSPPDPDSILGPENAFADSLDHLSVVRALEGWEVTPGTSSVSIGIVDTGVYFEHPDLADQFRANPAEDLDGDRRLEPSDVNGVDEDGNGYTDDVVGYDFVDRPKVIGEGEYRDRDPDPSPDSTGAFSGHGTAVAGVVSAAAEGGSGVVGVAPETRIVALRALAGDGRGRIDDIAAAIVYGASEGLDVLNLSFGRDHSAPLLEEAIEFAVDQGTVVVASAGNAGAVDDPHYPSDYPEVISTMWLAEDGEGVPSFSRSQYGIGVDLGAPGSDVFTTQYPRLRLLDDEPVRERDLYGSSSGSSFSAPQVAGAAALLRSVDSTLSPASIQSILTATAADIRDASWSHTSGAGRLDVARGLLRSYPAQTELHRPEHDQGIVGTDPFPIVGTALDPSFESYSVYYAEGTRDLDERPDPWIPISGPVETRAHRDTLGTWDVSSLSEGEYTLRLVTTLRDGRTVEDRRRVVVDDTPPEAELKFVGAGRVEGEWGVIADVAADDTVRSEMRVQLRGQTHATTGEHERGRHGLTWSDERGLGGEATVRITLTNRSGLESEIERSVTVPSNDANPSYFERTETSVPSGFLLSEATDLDDDRLPEVVVNQYEGGGLSDTLRAFEWTSSGFVSSDTLLARLIPKDIGDTNQDGNQELLLQVRGATILLEQSEEGNQLPRRLVYADTTAVSPSQEGPSLYGALLTNLDDDEWGEIVGNWKVEDEETRWRVLERDGDAFEQVAEVQNPTPHDAPDTTRTSPTAATADFDGDGRQDLLVGDGDGDWIVYESTAGGGLEVAWTHETDRVGTDRRFAVGDVTGNGRPEFVTYATYNPTSIGGRESEPEISYYSVWTSVGDDAYERLYRLPVAGEHTAFGSITAADFDGNGRDEVAIAHPPSLFVVGASSGGDVRVLHQDRSRPSVRSPALTAADFDGDGVPSLIASTTDENTHRFVPDRSAMQRPPPQWVEAAPTGPSETHLTWRAEQADSVTVYAGPPDGPLDPLAVHTDSSAQISGAAPRRFALRAWRDGEASPLSPERHVRPHAAASVSEVSYPDPSSVRLRFTEPLQPDLQVSNFELESHGAPRSVVPANNGTGVVLQFSSEVAGTERQLSWTALADTSGLAVDQTEVAVAFPAPDRRSLFVKTVDVLDEQTVQLTFSQPLDGGQARDPDHYAVRPHGFVEEVRAEGQTPTDVTVVLDGVVVGAVGQEASLRVSSLQSADGDALVEEGATVRLTEPADDLSDVYVYPNPIELPRHDRQLTVAGLPPTAEIRIFSPAGRLVEQWSVEGGRTGGSTWDLRDRRGELVPAGIYLIRVTAPDNAPVLKKAAIIR